MARLILQGKDEGVMPFIVQLRSLEDHSVLPGLEIGDIGAFSLGHSLPVVVGAHAHEEKICMCFHMNVCLCACVFLHAWISVWMPVYILHCNPFLDMRGVLHGQRFRDVACFNSRETLVRVPLMMGRAQVWIRV